MRLGEGVADLRVVDVLHVRDADADLARLELLHRLRERREVAELLDLELLAVRPEPDRLLRLEGALEHPHEHDDAAVRVVPGVEHDRLERRVGVAVGRRHLLHHGLEDLLDSDPLLRRARHRLGRVETDDLLDLPADLLHVGGGQVDLVDDRDDLEVVVERLVDVREGLGLDALGRVDDEDRALARGERARDLVREVHVPGRVDEVELVVLAVLRAVLHADGLGLDGDPALPLQLHVVEELGLLLPLRHRAGLLEEPVRERGFAVIDVRDDGEVADV